MLKVGVLIIDKLVEFLLNMDVKLFIMGDYVICIV